MFKTAEWAVLSKQLNVLSLSHKKLLYELYKWREYNRINYGNYSKEGVNVLQFLSISNEYIKIISIAWVYIFIAITLLSISNSNKSFKQSSPVNPPKI